MSHSSRPRRHTPAVITCALLLALFAFLPNSAVAQRSRLGVNGQGKILIMGDSLTIGTAAFGSLSTKIMKTGLWTSVVLNTHEGRKASVGADLLVKSVSADTTAIVVALGTNDMLSRTETWYPKWVIDKVMTSVKNLPVLWVNLEFSDTRSNWKNRAVRFNKELVKAKTRYANLSIADWNTSFTPKSGSRFIEDGVHLTVKGYRTRATFMLPAITRFGTDIVNATSTTTTLEPSTTTTDISTTTVPL